jgi:predicted patatin/cPLA2 family phospholipase
MSARPACDNCARPGHPVILETLRRVVRGRWGGDVGNRDTKLALVVEGGGMRGVMSGGSLIAMERLGLTAAFDEVYAESAGAINACYFLGGEAAFGGRIYLEDLTSVRFMNPMRRGKLFDVDFLVDHVMSRVKPLPVARVIQARSRLFVSLTNVNDGTGRVVDVKKENVPLLTLLKATAAIIPLYNSSVVLEGVPYADGGIADPIPVQNAINNGCTHILVLLTRPPDFVARPYRGLQRLILEIMLRRWDRRFVDAFLNVRYRRYNEARAIAFGKVPPPPDVELAVICPASTTPMVTRTTISPRRLKAAMDDSIARTTALFGAICPSQIDLRWIDD